MKKSEENRLKCVVYESTRAPLRGPPSPMGKAAIRGYRFSRHNAFPKGEGKEEAASPPKKEANPASRGHSLLPMEGGAPRGRRLDGKSGMKESEGDRLKYAVCESTLSTADAVPLPQWGRLRYEDTAFLDTTPFPRGKAKRRRLRRPKRKPTPPRCARQPLPREGGSRGHSLLPMEGGAPKGRRLDGKSDMKESEGDRLKYAVCESTLSTADAVPLPQWGRLRYENTAFLDTTPFPRGKAKSAEASPQIYMGRCPKVCG